MTALLECIDVRKQFGSLVAAGRISLAVQRGEVLGIIGANGAGKTTLLNIISGYLRPTSGRIVFDGTDITGLPSRVLCKKGIARSFQIPQLFNRLTSIENVMVALALANVSRLATLRAFENLECRRQAHRILANFDIHRHAETAAELLPQGVRKLLDIAVATSTAPTLVLLDEPTSGVSTEEKFDLMNSLWKALRSSSTTIVFIEHDMEIVRKYASRVAALYEGTVIAEGASHDVLSNREVRRLISGETATQLKA